MALHMPRPTAYLHWLWLRGNYDVTVTQHSNPECLRLIVDVELRRLDELLGDVELHRAALDAHGWSADQVAEVARLAFVAARDGLPAAEEFARRGLGLYRVALRTPYGKAYRRTLVESCIIYRQFLRGAAPYAAVRRATCA
jgi:hypothetical protein